MQPHQAQPRCRISPSAATSRFAAEQARTATPKLSPPRQCPRRTQRRRLSRSTRRTRPRPHPQPPSPPVNPPPRSRSGEGYRPSVPRAMIGALPRVASASLTPTLPKRQSLRRRLRSLRLRMLQLQQRTRIVRSCSQTMSSCPITTNFVAFDEQQEVAVGDLPHRLPLTPFRYLAQAESV